MRSSVEKGASVPGGRKVVGAWSVPRACNHRSDLSAASVRQNRNKRDHTPTTVAWPRASENRTRPEKKTGPSRPVHRSNSLGNDRSRSVSRGRKAGVEHRPREDVELPRVGGQGGGDHAGNFGAVGCGKNTTARRARSDVFAINIYLAIKIYIFLFTFFFTACGTTKKSAGVPPLGRRFFRLLVSPTVSPVEER